VSTYKNAKVKLNFGPKFKFLPKTAEDFRPMSMRAEEMAVEQTLADMKFFTENEGKLRLDNYAMES
jgi:Set1/Ash2 histone methyltransferase complex subunit ASH2